MGFIIGLLTFVMIVDCVVLVFLVLIQLPKKEAGAGLAFGGSASDALFGAGSGNVLTNITKYVATFFFLMAIVLAVLQSSYSSRRTSAFQRQLEKAPSAIPTLPAPGPATPSTPPKSSALSPAPLTSSNLLESVPSAPTTPAPATTNTPTPK